MLVGLVTNWGDQCSIAEYARNLLDHFPKGNGIEIKVISHPLTFDNIYLNTRDVDVIHFNHIEAWLKYSVVERVAKAHTKQKKVITYQENPEVLNEGLFDAIVLHDTNGFKAANVHCIPNGLRLVSVEGIPVQRKIGSAGFISEPKRFDQVASAAKELGVGCLLLCPQACCGNDTATKELVNKIRSINPDVEIDTRYLPYDDVVKRLAECMLTVFPYDLETYPKIGIGNAVRFGLATGKPVVVRRHHHFRDLFDYPDEMYFIEDNSIESTVDVIKTAMLEIDMQCEKVPTYLVNKLNWNRCAAMYADLYKDVFSVKEVA